MNDKEQWKPIPQFEELYEVSDKGNVRSVARLDRDGDTIEIYKSVNDAARQMGVRGENISRCCNGKYSQSCGYGWKYVDNDG